MATLEEIETRLGRVEDELEICRLIARYSPLVDCGAADRAPRLWLHDGVYDTEFLRMTTAAEIEAMLRHEGHRAYIDAGVAHVMGYPVVSLDGDHATALNYTRVYVRDGTTFRVDRVSANHWTLLRTVKGWRVKERVNRLVGPDLKAAQLLGDNVKDPECL